jgi:ubiquinone/menaquinone biosynthesis C-methylase UbiE
MNAGAVFAEPLVDLGVGNPAFAGIQTPLSALGATKVGVTEQFLERAEEYHKSYLDLDYWRFLLGKAVEVAGLRGDPTTVIDIGSGSGNSVIPLADRFPRAEIVATDISPQLLAILRDFLCRRPDPERFALVCVDATSAVFREGIADLAVGAAILHHVLDPARVIASCFQALRPGGWAIFFEPFEAGNTILKLTYQRILAQASAAERASEAMRFLERMVTDYAIRQRPKSDPIFRQLDDKWLFTRTYFERIRDEQGWAELITYGLNLCATPLRNQATVHLRLGLQATPDALPMWAWAVIDEMDAGVSDDLKQEWIQEGAALFRKPSRP